MSQKDLKHLLLVKVHNEVLLALELAMAESQRDEEEMTKREAEVAKQVAERCDAAKKAAAKAKLEAMTKAQEEAVAKLNTSFRTLERFQQDPTAFTGVATHFDGVRGVGVYIHIEI